MQINQQILSMNQ